MLCVRKCFTLSYYQAFLLESLLVAIAIVESSVCCGWHWQAVPFPMAEVEIDEGGQWETALVPYQAAQPSPAPTVPSPTSPAPDDDNQQHVPIAGVGMHTFQTTCAVKGCDSKFIRQPTRPGKQESSSLQSNIVKLCFLSSAPWNFLFLFVTRSEAGSILREALECQDLFVPAGQQERQGLGCVSSGYGEITS